MELKGLQTPGGKMLCSKRLVVLTTLVTVFSCYARNAWCASLTNNDNNNNLTQNRVTNWDSRSSSNNATTERTGRQYSSNHISNSNNNNYFHNANLNKGDSQSSFSITPSHSNEFHASEHEHLDKIVQAHQNSAVNSFDVGDSSSSSGSSSVGDVVVSTKISSGSVTNDNAATSSRDSAGLNTASSQRRSDVVSDFPRASGIVYPAQPDYSLYQNQRQSDNQVAANDQSSSGQNGESKQQPYQAFSDPRAVSQKKYLAQKEQVGNNRFSNPSVPYARQPATKDGRNDLAYSTSSRGPENQQMTNVSPITYQGQRHHQKMYTATSYLPGDISTARSISVARFSGQQKRVDMPAGNRRILESRADTYEGPEEAGQEEEDHHHYYDHGDGQYGQGQAGEPYEHDHDHNHDHDHGENENEYYYGNNANDQEDADEDPALRDFGEKPGAFGGGFGGEGGGPGGVGIGVGIPQPPGLPPPGLPGPVLPPPPGPLKGSIDYILIPLILIGLAGPIFVVLYVILGGFEYKLAPIVRRSLETSYTDYQVYANSVLL